MEILRPRRPHPALRYTGFRCLGHRGGFSGRKVQMKAILTLLLLPVIATHPGQTAKWRQASERELGGVIPARASVMKERIETETRTASGVTDGHGKFIAGVVMITAGYAAEGKYSHFFITQVPIRIADVQLKPGAYVFGLHRQDEDTIELTFYEADSGQPIGTAKAVPDKQGGPIRSLIISPPDNGKAFIKVGRFAAPYSLFQ
jgi:hypothetical protein